MQQRRQHIWLLTEFSLLLGSLSVSFVYDLCDISPSINNKLLYFKATVSIGYVVSGIILFVSTCY